MDKVVKETPNDCALTKSEKIQVIILLIFNTLISWAIFSFGWKKNLPTKSKQVNKYLKNIIFTLVGIALLGIITTIVLVATNPSAQMSK